MTIWYGKEYSEACSVLANHPDDVLVVENRVYGALNTLQRVVRKTGWPNRKILAGACLVSNVDHADTVNRLLDEVFPHAKCQPAAWDGTPDPADGIPEVEPGDYFVEPDGPFPDEEWLVDERESCK